MRARDDTSIFEQARPRLLGLAYRILGSRADAEDAVQDVFIKWQGTDHDAIDNRDGWLTTACTRRCIEMLQAAHRTRVDYVGTGSLHGFPAAAEPAPGAATDNGRRPADGSS